MKRLKLIAVALSIVCAIYAFTNSKREQKSFDVTAYRFGATIGCMSNIGSIGKVLDSVEIQPMHGVGDHKWKIATTSDSTQFYFNQGINLYYGFHTIESLASFKKAAKFDSSCTMAWWGQALALGPIINDFDFYVEKPEALDAIQKAKLLSAAAPPIEKLLVDAMMERYSADTTRKRAQLNQRYREAMQKIYMSYKDNSDIAALYADAMLIQHPWNYWNLDGTAKAWTSPIESVLEALLVKTPEHPGANHYYIHLMEGSPFAAKALPSADRLGQLTPGQAHMVHMPSHIYLRTGNYDKGVLINEASVMLYKQESAAFSPVQSFAKRHNNHARHMAANCAMLAGQYTKAIQTALQLQHRDSAELSLPEPIGNYVQYVFMTPIFIDIRFEKWNNLLQMKQPFSKHIYANVLYHFGRGVAYAVLNQVSKAEEELKKLQELMLEKTLTLPFGTLSPPIEGAKIANELLQGLILFRKQKQDEAIDHFSKAVVFDDGIAYFEPRVPWLLNPRQYLGTAYLKAKQQEKATVVFKRDLQRNADNVWSLYGLYQALDLQHKKAEADSIKMKFDKAAAKSDIDFSELEFSTASIK